MKRRFILNPAAGRGGIGHAMAGVERFFRERTGAFDCVRTGSREETIECTRRALREGVEQVVALGGDGTANAVVNGFMAEEEAARGRACLALAALGTGADYFRGLTLDAGATDWRRVVLEPAVRAVDVGRAVFTGSGRVVHFLNALGVGLAGVVARQAQAMPRWMPGAAAYLLPTLAQFVLFRPQAATFTVDGQGHDVRLLLAYLTKGPFVGGGMRIGDRPALDDGRVDVTLIPSQPLLGMLAKLPRLYREGLAGLEEVTQLRGSEVEIDAPNAMPVEVDGDPVDVTPVRVTVLRQAVRVCCADAV